MDAKRKQRWQDLSPGQQSFILGLGVGDLVTTTAAMVDLARRPRQIVRGPKLSWVATAVVQPFDPVAYLLFHRH